VVIHGLNASGQKLKLKSVTILTMALNEPLL
jgi:hypothetical protein